MPRSGVVSGPDLSSSQADSAGSIPVTRSDVKPQVSGMVSSLIPHLHDVSSPWRARCVPDEPAQITGTDPGSSPDRAAPRTLTDVRRTLGSAGWSGDGCPR